jgi:hypothetical protein
MMVFKIHVVISSDDHANDRLTEDLILFIVHLACRLL